MALLGEVFFNVGIKSQQFESGISKMQTSAQKFESTIKKLGATLTAVFGAAGFIATMKKNLDLWAKQEEATIKLTFAVNQFAKGNKQLLSNLQTLGNYMQKQIGVGNEYVENIAAIGLSMGITGDRIEDATKASILLSKVLGTDAQTLMRGFAQTLEGTVGILGRYIPEVRSLTEEQLKNGEAIDLIVKKFTGLEETLSTTTTAAIDKFKASLGDVGEVLGSKLAPLVSKAADWMYDFSSRVQENGSVLKTLKEYLIDFWKGLDLVGRGVIAFIGTFIGLKIAGAAWNLLTGIIISGGKLIVNVLSAIFSWPTLIIAALYLLRVAWKYNWFDIRDTLLSAWDSMKKGWKGAWDNLKDIWSAPDLNFLDKVAASIGLIANKIWKGDENYKGLGTIWKEAWDKLKEIWQNPDLSFLEKVKKSFSTLGWTVLRSAITIGAALTAAFGGNTKQYITETTNALDDLKKKLDEFKEAPTLTLKLEKAFELGKEIYQLPAKFLLSGFMKTEDFDKTWFDNLANMLPIGLAVKLISGKLGIAVGFALLADFIFGDEWTGNKWINQLIAAGEAVGISFLLVGGKLTLPVALSLYLAKDLFTGTGDRQKAEQAWKAWFEYTKFGSEEAITQWARENLPAMFWQADPKTLAEMAKDTFDKAFQELTLVNQGVVLGTTLVTGIVLGVKYGWQKVENTLKSLFTTTEKDFINSARDYANKYYSLPGNQSGGYTGNVGVDQVAGVVHGGEWVAPAWMVKRYSSLIAMLEVIRRRGYKSGGFVGYQNGGNVAALTPGVYGEEDTVLKQIIDTMKEDFNRLKTIAETLMNTLKEKFGIELPNNLDNLVNQFDKLQAELDELNQTTEETKQTMNSWQKDIFSKLASKSELFTFDTEKGLQFADIQGTLISVLAEFILGIDSLVELLNPFTTILNAMFEIIGPIIDNILKPFASALSAIGRLLAGVLAPALKVLSIVLKPVIWLLTAFSWAIDQIVLFVNSLPFIGGFLSTEQKREMKRSIRERMEEYTGTTSPSGEIFTVGSTQSITNNFNFYFSDNMLLTEDDEGARRLAELVVAVLKEQGIEVVT